MTAKLTFLPLFFLIFLIVIIPQVYAEDPDIDIDDLPQRLADHLGIGLFPSQILLSSLAMLSVALTLSLLKAKGILILITCFFTMAFLIAIAWLPYWIMLLVTLLVGVLYSAKIKNMM